MLAARAENRAVAAQLTGIGQLFAYRLARSAETQDWAIDTMEAVAAEVGAALRISQGLAASRLPYARAMREQLPQVAAVFRAGDIDYRAFQTPVYRTELIEDRHRAVGGMPAPETDPAPDDYCAQRSAMMPKRRRTRAQDHAYRVATERRHNRSARLNRRAESAGDAGPAPPDDEPPPF
ncbi:hypothetical protein A4G26_07820 [Mycobacterium kansasii]|nr:hypothetical protein A4G26_07820 [Mycobacterium kansasii]